MSKLINVKRRCAICNTESTYEEYAAISSFGSMDLDTRPPLPKRATLGSEITVCKKCHYANTGIDNPIPGITLSTLNDEEYQKIYNNKVLDDVTKKFLMAAYLYDKSGDMHHSGILHLMLAWHYDDLMDGEFASIARRAAIERLTQFAEESYNLNIATLVIDLLRRTEQFELALENANQLLEIGVSPLLEKILKFEIHLCGIRDTKVHTVEEA